MEIPSSMQTQLFGILEPRISRIVNTTMKERTTVVMFEIDDGSFWAYTLTPTQYVTSDTECTRVRFLMEGVMTVDW